MSVDLQTVYRQEIEAPIFDIQRFSIHDGPGIRTLVFFKGCNLKCDWCQNPESQQAAPRISFYQHRCQHSLDCLAVCKHEAIKPEGFRVDHAKCTGCLKCVEACAFDALKAIGEQMTPAQLMRELEKDLAYYQSSGGGVTFSGGEPTLYPKFMAVILKRCQQQGIHTTLETCGSFSFKRWQNLLGQLSLIYFDLKVMDGNKHQHVTGHENARILENARQLVTDGYPIEFRLTLVEGYTDDEENLSAIRAFLISLNIDKLHLQAYHNMGECKIDLIDGEQKKLGLPNYPPSRFDMIKAEFEDNGIRVCVF